MITTENEAKKKVCIHVRLRASTAPGASTGYNRTRLTTREWFEDWLYKKFASPLHEFTRGRYFHCQGSGCMSWRWAYNGKKHGYCGLSGTPHAAAHDPPALPAQDPGEQNTTEWWLIWFSAIVVLAFAFVARWIVTTLIVI
jgi:hypothetical protein